MKNFLKGLALLLVFAMALTLNHQMDVTEAHARMCDSIAGEGYYSTGEHELNGSCYNACVGIQPNCYISCDYNYWCSGCPSGCS
ncbi:hypothetical protein [Flavilitoribacter nigricans]|uniref:hypothetical protein n=1 Tax=Flavilitoribacter nigricans TaxID=70997 RepID=UPI00117B87D2|nr:hypothetical protein [Flavilitoribacter nigricans]